MTNIFQNCSLFTNTTRGSIGNCFNFKTYHRYNLLFWIMYSATDAWSSGSIKRNGQRRLENMSKKTAFSFLYNKLLYNELPWAFDAADAFDAFESFIVNFKANKQRTPKHDYLQSYCAIYLSSLWPCHVFSRIACGSIPWPTSCAHSVISRHLDSWLAIQVKALGMRLPDSFSEKQKCKALQVKGTERLQEKQMRE